VRLPIWGRILLVVSGGVLVLAGALAWSVGEDIFGGSGFDPELITETDGDTVRIYEFYEHGLDREGQPVRSLVFEGSQEEADAFMAEPQAEDRNNQEPMLMIAVGAVTVIVALIPVRKPRSLKLFFWGLAVAATTLGVGLFFGVFWGLGIGSMLDDVLTTETRGFLFFWPLVLLVSTFVGGLVGTRSFRNALMTSVAAVLVGGVVWAVGLLVGVEDRPAGFMFVGVGLVVFLVRTWTSRPQSLRTSRDESPTRT